MPRALLITGATGKQGGSVISALLARKADFQILDFVISPTMAAYAALQARQIFDVPMRRTRMDNHPTLLVSWWCSGCALVLILVRLWGRCVRTEKLFLEDKIMALSIIPLFVRMALVDPVMLWGTNNVVPAASVGPG